MPMPMVKDLRAPKSTRLKTSRPELIGAHEMFRRRRLQLYLHIDIAAGIPRIGCEPGGEKSSQNEQCTDGKPQHEQPVSPGQIEKVRYPLLFSSQFRAGAFNHCFHHDSLSSSNPNLGIDQGINQIDQQVNGATDDGENDGHSHDTGIIIVDNGEPHKSAHARPVKDILD